MFVYSLFTNHINQEFIMTNKKKFSNVTFAATAAALFSTMPMTVVHAADDSMVHCYGVNKCKGHNDCKTAHNACKGHGSCKGKGFVAMSAQDCTKAGGSTKEPKK
jgi:uncharacterized membrane protein